VRVVSFFCGSVLIVYGAVAGVPLEAAQAKAKPPVAPKPSPSKIINQAAKQPAKQVPVEQLQRLLNMSPENREKNLSKLAPAQRTRIQNQLDNLDKMPPGQRAVTLDMLRRLENLPPARQQAVNQEMQRIQKLPTVEERSAVIHSPEFQQSFSPEEQELLRERFPGAAK
jgi:hypothetical protein